MLLNYVVHITRRYSTRRQKFYPASPLYFRSMNRRVAPTLPVYHYDADSGTYWLAFVG